MKKYNFTDMKTIMQGMVKDFSLKMRLIVGCLLLGLLSSTSLMQAGNFYVAPVAEGLGDGTSIANAANIGTLYNKIGGTGGIDNNLTVYFMAGTYNMTGTFNFNSTSTYTGGTITFASYTGNASSVIINGGDYLFATLVARASGTRLKLVMENITLQNFARTTAALGYSIINLYAYNDLEVKGCIIQNNSVAAMNYLFHGGAANSTFTFTNTQFKNNTRGGMIYSIGAAASSSLSIANCSFTGNGVDANTTVPMVYNTSAFTSLNDCEFTNNNTSANILYSGYAGAALTIERTKFTNNTSRSNRVIYKTGTAALTINNSKFEGNQTSIGLINTANSLTMSNDSILNNNSTTGEYFIYFDGSSASSISNSYFEGNSLGSNVYASFIRIASTGTVNIYNNYFVRNSITTGSATVGYAGAILYYGAGTSYTYQNTFYNNAASGTGSSIIRLNGGTHTLYNNTLSSNTGTGLYVVTTNSVVLNNTFYSPTSGASNLYISGTQAGTVVRNNLLIGSYINPSTTLAGGYCSYNISGGRYYEGSIPSGGTSGGTTLAGILSCFDTNLTRFDPNLPPIHDVLNLNDANNCILRKGNRGDASTTWYSRLATDQRGINRPTYVPISTGSIDYDMKVYAAPISKLYIFKPAEGLFDMAIDFSQYISKDPNISLSSIAITFDDLSHIGTLTPTAANYIYNFRPNNDGTTPDPDILNDPITINYTVSYISGGTTYYTYNTLTLRVVNLGVPPPIPGLVDNLSGLQCYGTMGTIAFSSRENYRNTTTFVGFTVPLVGDLNGDGFPELVALSGAGESATTITIVDGRNGSTLKNQTITTIAQGWHCTPSSIALIDSDRDGLGEIIVAYPPASAAPNSGRLTSYQITSASDFTLTVKWRATTPFSSVTDMRKPIPQVLDFDGDSNPEVMAYNRIYDAQTGALKMTLETLAYNDNETSAFVGKDMNARASGSNDRTINFSYTYDIDLDGIYDIAAGGKVYYDLNFASVGADTLASVLGRDFKIARMTGVPDGRTSVADINGDSIPDVVVMYKTAAATMNIVVWSPDLLRKVNGQIVRYNNSTSPWTPTPVIMAQETLTVGIGASTGSGSYVYIGDIDGRRDATSGKLLPEIAVLTGNITASTVSVHPNVASTMPTRTTYGPGGTNGVIFGLTWDDAPSVAVSDRLKLSFILEHEDTSINTGFTMFDFDNDGIQEICYRDTQTLRIIKANKPYIYLNEAVGSGSVLFQQPATSYTGFEYPSIADIDGDNSADMMVMGTGTYDGNLICISTDTYKFAPALAVWNQFMYSPFKINEDLTTPIGPARNPLDIVYTRDISGAQVDYRPFNGSLIQAPHYMEEVRNGYTYMEPILFQPDGYIVDPQISGTTITFRVGNKNGMKSTIPTNTPIYLYKLNAADDPIPSATPVGKYTLSALGLTKAVEAGAVSELLTVTISDAYGIYSLRLSDDSNPSIPEWSYGTNDAAYNDPTIGVGEARRYLRDCDWSDNETLVAKFVLANDYATIQEYDSIMINILANDIIPADLNPTVNAAIITKQPTAGRLSYVSNQLRYTHIGDKQLVSGIDTISYSLTYNDPVAGSKTLSANVYVYVMESSNGGFVLCYDETADIAIKAVPPGVTFNWFQSDGITPIATGQTSITVTATSDTIFRVKPVMSAATGYTMMNFPLGTLKVSVATHGLGDIAVLKWTGRTNTDWSNPNNWTDELGNPVSYPPTSCVDVIIPPGLKNYPSLIKNGRVRDIDLENRAMLVNTHYLQYRAANMEVLFDATERDRWVMYSAPFGKMYSGDFMLPGTDGYPLRSAVYMSFFQQVNPDNASETAVVNQFTRSFSNVEQELTLGRGFIIKIDGNVDATTPFRFPSPVDQYEYYYKNLWNENVPIHPLSAKLARTMATRGDTLINTRFITEMATNANAKGVFSLTLPGDMAGSNLLMVTNPFNAYLDVTKFFAANTGLNSSAYYVWGGNPVTGFIAFQQVGKKWVVSTPGYITSNGSSGNYVAPYQSFFVLKTGTAQTPVTFNPETMTSTINTGGADYVLRNATASSVITPDALYVAAAVNGNESTTSILPVTESISADKLFLNDAEAVVDIYSLNANGKAMAMNSIGDFSKEMKLGLRLKESGEVLFTFTGIPNVEGYNVFLKDGDKLYPVSEGTRYRLNVEKSQGISSAANGYFEVNSRFSLVFVKKP